MSDRPSTQIKCSDCGKTANVPFKPTAGKPVIMVKAHSNEWLEVTHVTLLRSPSYS